MTQALRDLPDRIERPPAPRLMHIESCVSCRAEPHSHHAEKPNSSPIIICLACKIPTRHRFSRAMAKATVQQGTDLIWACAACESERLYGCVG